MGTAAIVLRQVGFSTWQCGKNTIKVVAYSVQPLQDQTLLFLNAPVLQNCRLKLVAEEDSEELRDPAQAGMLSDVCNVFNSTLAGVIEDAPQLSTQEVCDLIDLGNSPGGQGQHWVLDPIDGTRGFEAARQYSVCLGMIQDGKPVLGVCTYCPGQLDGCNCLLHYCTCVLARLPHYALQQVDSVGAFRC